AWYMPLLHCVVGSSGATSRARHDTETRRHAALPPLGTRAGEGVAECCSLDVRRGTATQCMIVPRFRLLPRGALGDEHAGVELVDLLLAAVFPADHGVEREGLAHGAGEAAHV